VGLPGLRRAFSTGLQHNPSCRPALEREFCATCGMWPNAAEDVAAEVWLEISRGLTPFLGGEREFRGAG
jgi:hypothetical protein